MWSEIKEHCVQAIKKNIYQTVFDDCLMIEMNSDRVNGFKSDDLALQASYESIQIRWS